MKFALTFFSIFAAIAMNGQTVCPEIPCCLPRLNFLNSAPADNFTVQGEFLYWKSYADTLDWGASFLSYTSPTLNISARDDLRIYNAEFEWDCGYRISGGFSICSWDNLFRWTSYSTKGSADTFFTNFTQYGLDTAVSRLGLTIWPSGNINSPVENLQTSQKLQLYCGDWELGSSLYITQNFFCRPFVGIRGARLNQHMDISYENTTLVGLEIASSLMQLKNDFTGIGPRTGADVKWHINEVFSMSATTALSLLGGKFSISENERFNYSTELTDFITSNNHFTLKTFKPSFDIRLGMEFLFDFCGKFMTEFDLGYEFHYWPEQTQLYRLYVQERAIKQVGDVFMQGLSLRAGVYF